ncbi:hypothetical protein ACFQ10_37820 [Streptomyces indonesiensis]
MISDSPRIAGENAEHIRVLAESDLAWPPITVHRPTMRVVDGVHRVRAALLRGEERIEAAFVDGTVEEAFVLAVRLNTRHGMPLSRADRTAAATRLVESRPRWSNRRIAEIVGVSPTTVATLRDRSTGRTGQSNVRAGRDGRVRPLGAGAAEGRRRAVRVIRSRPDASLREIAAEAGVAVATARDVRQRLRVGEDPVPPRLRAAEVRDSGRGEASPAAATPSAGDGKPAVTLPPEPPPMRARAVCARTRRCASPRPDGRCCACGARTHWTPISGRCWPTACPHTGCPTPPGPPAGVPSSGCASPEAWRSAPRWSVTGQAEPRIAHLRHGGLTVRCPSYTPEKFVYGEVTGRWR